MIGDRQARALVIEEQLLSSREAGHRWQRITKLETGKKSFAPRCPHFPEGFPSPVRQFVESPRLRESLQFTAVQGRSGRHVLDT